MKESFECDVVVIGAGLSGLSAAYYLCKKDKKLRVVVVEAKDRIGGRTLTRQLTGADGSKDFWDMGGEWIGRPQPHVHYLLNKFEVKAFNPVAPTSGRQTSKVNNVSWKTFLDLKQFKWKIQRLQTKYLNIDRKNMSGAESLDDVLLETYLNEHMWTDAARGIVDTACHCMFGLMPSELSVLFFLKYVEEAGGLDALISEVFSGGECRIRGGTQQISYHLVNKIGKSKLYLSQPITDIIQSIEGVRITTSNGLYILCQRVIMAVPPHHAASIKYEPALPTKKVEWLKNVPLAFIIKFTITYDSPFWKKIKGHGKGYQCVLNDPKIGGPIGLVYDTTSARGNPALSGFISHADKIDPDTDSRRGLILSLVEQDLGPQCQQFLEFEQKDWSTEPYNGGCFIKNFFPETFSYFHDVMRQPFNRIHFAGTETAVVWVGFMDGAIQSGFRAASEVLFQMRPMIAATPYPDDKPRDGTSNKQNGSNSKWLMYLAVVAGVVSAAYLFAKSEKLSSHGDTIVRHIKLVFD